MIAQKVWIANSTQSQELQIWNQIYEIIKKWETLIYHENPILSPVNFLIFSTKNTITGKDFFMIYSVLNGELQYNNRYQDLDKARIYVEYLKMQLKNKLPKDIVDFDSFCLYFDSKKVNIDEYLKEHLDRFLQEHWYFYETKDWEFQLKKFDGDKGVLVFFISSNRLMDIEQEKMSLAKKILKNLYNGDVGIYKEIKSLAKEGKIDYLVQKELLNKLWYVLNAYWTLSLKEGNKEVLRCYDNTLAVLEGFQRVLKYK